MEEDLYHVLGIQGGDSQVSRLHIRKAYHTRALVWHPDKQTGKKPSDIAAAAIEFERIQKAYEVLGDENARNAYDKLRNLRKNRLEKESQLSVKHQKMMQDLQENLRQKMMQDLRQKMMQDLRQKIMQDLKGMIISDNYAQKNDLTCQVKCRDKFQKFHVRPRRL